MPDNTEIDFGQSPIKASTKLSVNANLKADTKDARKLIERALPYMAGVLNGAVCLPGKVLESYCNRLIASNEVESAKIKAAGEIEINKMYENAGLEDLAHRAHARQLADGMRQQINMEEITRKALPLLGKDPKPEDIEEDWLAQFYEFCRNTSDCQMQELWAKILAGEASQKGSFSFRTLDLIKTITRTEIALFDELCSISIKVESQHNGILPVVLRKHEDLMRNMSGLIIFEQLESIGLIHLSDRPRFAFLGGKEGTIDYFGRKYAYALPHDGSDDLVTGEVLFTNVGLELFKLSKPTFKGWFEKYMICSLGYLNGDMKITPL